MSVNPSRRQRKTLRTNKPKETQYTAEHLHDQDFDEELGVRSIAQCCGRPSDPDADTTQEVAHTDGQAAPEQGVAGEVVVWSVKDEVRQGGELG